MWVETGSAGQAQGLAVHWRRGNGRPWRTPGFWLRPRIREGSQPKMGATQPTITRGMERAT